MNKYDVVVIGAGPGGYPAAIRAAQLGRRVAVVEKEALGGTCLNWGCIPIKTLIASAEVYRQASDSAVLGISCGRVSFDYGRMVARKGAIVKKFAGGVQQLLKANDVDILSGTARFEGPQRLAIRTAEGNTHWLQADRTIIATGSVSAMPDFLPKHPRVLESRTFLDLTKLPKSLIVLGGSVIGCEFACLAAQLGTKVTVVEMLDDILPMVDRDVCRVLRKQMEGHGITFCTGAPLTHIEAGDAGVSGLFGERKIDGEMLLVAIGRAVNTDELDLPSAGVKTDARGQIVVDAACRTAQPNIFAVGDVVSGNLQLAHVATAQGLLAADARSRQSFPPAFLRPRRLASSG